MKATRYAVAGLIALSLWLIAAGPAPAQAPGADRPGAVVLPPEQGDRVALGVAKQMLKEGRYADAYQILLILERRRPEERELQVLIAQVEVALEKPDSAVARLEALAAKHPDWPRPRVELALAHAAAGNIRTAKAILVAELGKDPPEHVRRNIEAAIRALEDQQTFVGRFDLNVAPDSNITGGTYNETVSFMGLPFTLNDDAKQQEGVRGTISLGGTLRTPWKEDTRIELGVDGTHSEPLGDKGTPSSNLQATLSARIRGPKGTLRTGFRVQPFYWDNALQRIEHGIFAEGGRRIDGPFAMVGSVTLTEGDVAGDALRDFRQWETSLGPALSLGRTTRLQVQGVLGRRNAEDELYSFLRRGLSVGMVASPINGWRVSFDGSLTRDVYGDYSVFFGARQEDLTAAASLQTVWTGVVVLGVSPSLNLGYSETRSTIDLYDRRSVSFGLGLALPY